MKKNSHSSLGRYLLVMVLAAPWMAGGAETEIIDKIVAVVGDEALTASEVDRQVAFEAFDSEIPIDLSADHRRRALSLLIQRLLVRREMELAGLPGATAGQVSAQLKRSEQTFGGSVRFRNLLSRYGLGKEDAAAFLQEQLNFERFRDLRFRTGMVIPREEVEDFYKREYGSRQGAPNSPKIEDVYRQIEDELTEQRVEPLFNDWLQQVRSRTRIVIKDESLRGARF